MKNQTTLTSHPLNYSWDYIIQILLKHKKPLLTAHLVAILGTLMTAPVPLLMPLLVDEVLLNKPGIAVATINRYSPNAWHNPILYIGVVLISSLLLRLIGIVFNIIQTKKFSHLSKNVIFQIRRNLIQRLQFISMSEYETLGSGTVITHFVTDLDTLDQFIGTTLSKLVLAFFTILAVAIILLWMNWQLGTFILLLNPIVIYCTRIVGSRVKNLKYQENSAYGLFQQALSETLEAIQQIRASNREQHYCQVLTDAALIVKQNSINYAWKSDAVNRLSFLIFLFGFDIFRALAMIMVFYSNLSIGQMLAVFGYLWYMMSPVQELLNIQYAFYAAKAALERINRINNLKLEPVYPHLKNPFLKSTTVSIEIKNLHFSYGDQEILNGIHLSIKKAGKVALVGASGGGKSTLVQALIGLYPMTQGMIYFNNVPINQIGLDIVREHVAIVLQHPALFNDSIRANLTLGRVATETELWQALEIAQLKDTVAELEHGLETLVGCQGMKLSGGQRQRLAIARMIIAKPSVVILDEATSALDSATEYRLHQALSQFLKNRTTLIIAHRLSAVKQADKVYVFESGRICEQGQHETLIQQNGLYAKLYQQYQ